MGGLLGERLMDQDANPKRSKVTRRSSGGQEARASRSGFEAADLSAIRTVPIAEVPHKVGLRHFARPPDPAAMGDLLDALPDLLSARDLRAVADAIARARHDERPVVLAFGGHVIKCGLGPLIIDLMERGVVTALATHGAGAIHDLEIALVGETSEDVGPGLDDATFGMAEETGRYFAEALVTEGAALGAGRALGQAILGGPFPYNGHSVLAAAARRELPCTVHIAIGTDTTHMHPAADGAAMGAASYRDFLLLCDVVSELEDGVWLNVGSAVILPEVFLKALTVARNLMQGPRRITTVNLDRVNHYRPAENVLRRPTNLGGAAYFLPGPHELLVPLLYGAVLRALER